MTTADLQKLLPSKTEMTLDEHENAVIKDIFESRKRDTENNREYHYECCEDAEGYTYLFKVDLLSGGRYYVTGAWNMHTMQLGHTIANIQHKKWARIFHLEGKY